MTTKEYWNKRVKNQGKQAVILSSDNYKARTKDEKEVITRILKSHTNISDKVDLAIDYGCGHGRLTDVLTSFAKKVIGIDLSEENAKLGSNIIVSPIQDTIGKYQADLSMSYTVLQHITDESNWEASIKAIATNTNIGGYHLTYNYSHETKGKLAKHVIGKTWEDYTKTFDKYGLSSVYIEPWLSRYVCSSQQHVFILFRRNK